MHFPSVIPPRVAIKIHGATAAKEQPVSPLHNFATSLYEDIAERRSKYMDGCPVFKMCVQVASVLFPPLKTMSFKQALS
jgi:hypothetical protein